MEKKIDPVAVFVEGLTAARQVPGVPAAQEVYAIGDGDETYDAAHLAGLAVLDRAILDMARIEREVV